MFFDPIVVTQHNDRVEWITDSDSFSNALFDKAAHTTFPLGQAWHLYENARSFRLVPLTEQHSLLSYTLVLGEQHGTWNGRLHAWGLIGKWHNLIGADGLEMFEPHALFQFYQNVFVYDRFYNVMLNGLAQTPPETPTVPFSWWQRLKLSAKRLSLDCHYDNPTQWLEVEQLVYQTFRQKMAAVPNGQRHPITFATLALSKREQANILGIPTQRYKQPRVCLIG